MKLIEIVILQGPKYVANSDMCTSGLWILESRTAKNSKFLEFDETQCVASSDQYVTLDAPVNEPER